MGRIVGTEFVSLDGLMDPGERPAVVRRGDGAAGPRPGPGRSVGEGIVILTSRLSDVA